MTQLAICHNIHGPHSPTHRPWKASPQCTNPYFHSKNVALSIRAKHSHVILTLADICQLVKQGIDQILIVEAGDSRVRDSGCKNGTSIGTEENWGLPGDLWVIYVDIVYLILYVLHVTCNQFAIFARWQSALTWTLTAVAAPCNTFLMRWQKLQKQEACHKDA